MENRAQAGYRFLAWIAVASHFIYLPRGNWWDGLAVMILLGFMIALPFFQVRLAKALDPSLNVQTILLSLLFGVCVLGLQGAVLMAGFDHQPSPEETGQFRSARGFLGMMEACYIWFNIYFIHRLVSLKKPAESLPA